MGHIFSHIGTIVSCEQHKSNVVFVTLVYRLVEKTLDEPLMAVLLPKQIKIVQELRLEIWFCVHIKMFLCIFC